ncbi:PAS domain-containing sensor histidine kinase [Mesorhizobium sp. CAU 1741]|uniref:sensor histidine kinase n=1 Tax=Mesorhizobium sp. CAU 1741 TaxID=3140366 RepID=UPI00325A4A75
MAAGCDRLLHPTAKGQERARQRRLIGVCLAAPFVATPAIVQAVLPSYGITGALALLCGVFALSWLMALQVATRARSKYVEATAVAGTAVLSAWLVSLAGGIGTPIAALLIAVPIEVWWVSRSKRAAVAGGAAALLAAMVPVFGSGPLPIAAHWLWLSPALYAATLMLRNHLPTMSKHRSTGEEDNLLDGNAFDAALAQVQANGEVDSISAPARDLLGVEPDLLLGSGLFERIHVADRVAFLCAVADARDGGRARRLPVRMRMPVQSCGSAGGYKTFEVELLRGRAGGETVVALIRDGSELAALREELTQAQDAAGAMEIAKSRFLAAVSHELRTPLNAIIGFSDMLLHPEISGKLAAKQADHVTVIRDAGNHLLSVVNAILDVSKIESGSYQISVEPFELAPAVELCRAMLQPQAAEKHITLTVNVPSDIGEVSGDQRAVQQILLNLLSNAIKFTPDGGSVSVTASRVDGMVRVFVNDTGIGIAADDLNKLGRPFMQIQNDYTRQYQGTGLGLSLVKGLVALHGGSMSIESAPGMGTTVAVGLPTVHIALNDDTADSGAEPDVQIETGERHGIALRKIA